MLNTHTGEQSETPSGKDYEFYLPAVVTPTPAPGRIERFLSGLFQYKL